MKGLFGAQKASGSTIEEVAHLIQNYFKGRNLDYHKQELPGSEGCGWWLTEGSAKVYIFVQDSPVGPVMRITSPIVYIPENNKEAFYRHLLDLNGNLASCHLATYDNYVLVLAQRQTNGITQEDVDSTVWNVAYVADLLDDRLVAEYETTLYIQP
jgi:hypothetical protein